MNKPEAIRLMNKGFKLTHEYFDKNEWMTINSKGNILLEDGCQCSIEEFFSYRSDESWNEGYKLYESEIVEEESKSNSFLNLDAIYPFHMFDRSMYDLDSMYGLTRKQREANIVPVRTTPKIGRNEPCSCGSGRKNKNCCKQF